MRYQRHYSNPMIFKKRRMAGILKTGHHGWRRYNFTCLNIRKCLQCINSNVYQVWCFYHKVNNWFDMPLHYVGTEISQEQAMLKQLDLISFQTWNSQAITQLMTNIQTGQFSFMLDTWPSHDRVWFHLLSAHLKHRQKLQRQQSFEV